jgi:hypothetical protein
LTRSRDRRALRIEHARIGIGAQAGGRADVAWILSPTGVMEPGMIAVMAPV